MTRQNKYSTVLWMVIIAFFTVSCNKWLDVQPKDQVKDTELFSDETGFKESLSGIYSTLTYPRLYGREITFGLTGVLAAEWDYSYSGYNADKRYEYSTSSISLTRIDSLWNGLYFAIANANKLLEAADKNKTVFKGDNYNIIKGEALALRGFIHFDLLRLFGASFAENPDKTAIPYVTEYSSKIFPQLTVRAFIASVVTDLEAARELLKSDPLFTGKVITTANDDGYLINRQVHLNYYAVTGLLARVHLYQKSYDKALAYAQEVINSGKFSWVAQSAIYDKAVSDLTFSPEHLFALNVVNLSTVADVNFPLKEGGSDIFNLMASTLLNNYYEGNTADYRYLYQFEVSQSGLYYLQKYRQLTSVNWPAACKNKMPLIRLSEMYFIAAECLKTTDITQAASLVNTVRTHRGIGAAVMNASTFDDVVASEFRKEFIGEGQLFFYHKRLNHAFIPNASNFNLIALKGYKLPMPQSEYQNASGRVDNQ